MNGTKLASATREKTMLRPWGLQSKFWDSGWSRCSLGWLRTRSCLDVQGPSLRATSALQLCSHYHNQDNKFVTQKIPSGTFWSSPTFLQKHPAMCFRWLQSPCSQVLCKQNLNSVHLVPVLLSLMFWESTMLCLLTFHSLFCNMDIQKMYLLIHLWMDIWIISSLGQWRIKLLLWTFVSSLVKYLIKFFAQYNCIVCPLSYEFLFTCSVWVKARKKSKFVQIATSKRRE